MNKTTEALKLMKSALHTALNSYEIPMTAGIAEALTAANKAVSEELTEPVQEPVAWTNYNGAVNNRLKGAPVSAKREWVDLTDDEIYDALAEVRFVRDNLLDGCRALIAAFKEKNK